MCSNPIESALTRFFLVAIICAAVGQFKLKIENYAVFEWKMARKNCQYVKLRNGEKMVGFVLNAHTLIQNFNIKSTIRFDHKSREQKRMPLANEIRFIRDGARVKRMCFGSFVRTYLESG